MAVGPRAAAQPLVEGAVFEGRIPTPVVQSVARLRLPPSPSFVLLYNPALWDVAVVEGEPLIVPRLREFRFEPGQSGVEAVRGQAEGNPRRALDALAERGWLPVHSSIQATAWGQTLDGYVRVYDGVRGPVHLSVWSRPYVRGNQVVIDFDDDGWNRWRASLVTDGVIPGPDRSAKRALQLDLSKMLRRLQTAANKSASAMEQAEQYELRLTVFQGGRSAAPARPVASAPASAPEPAPREEPEAKPARRASRARAQDERGEPAIVPLPDKPTPKSVRPPPAQET